MIPQGENLFVGLIALALLPLIGLRLYRGLRDGRLPVYRATITREGSGGGKFWLLFVLHAASLLVVALVAADLLMGLGLRDAL